MPATTLKPIVFSDLRNGMRARIVAVGSKSKDSIRLQEMGLTVGTSFTVIKVAPFGDPIEIALRGYRLCLRKRETQGFEVEPIS